MKKILFLISLLFALTKLNAQENNDGVKRLLELDGTSRNISELIKSTIEYHKQTNPGIRDGYWDRLEQRAQESLLKDFHERVGPIYRTVFDDDEILRIIRIYESADGRLIVEKQPELIEALALPLSEWSQKVNARILEEIENREAGITDTLEVKKFENEFRNRNGLEITNMSELKIDNEHNIGTLVIDFGITDGTKDLEKRLSLKNNTDSVITFEDFFSKTHAEVQTTLPSPIQPGDTDDIIFTLKASKAENQVYFMRHLMASNGQDITIGFEYQAPTKTIEYSVSDTILVVNKFKGKYSAPYEFRIHNTGSLDFNIQRLQKTGFPAYISYSDEVLKPGEETLISIILPKDTGSNIIKREQGIEVKVYLQKSRSGYQPYPDKTFRIWLK